MLTFCQPLLTTISSYDFFLVTYIPALWSLLGVCAAADVRLGGCAWGSLLKCRGLNGLEVWWLVGWRLPRVWGWCVPYSTAGRAARGMGTYTDTQSLLHVTLTRANNNIYM